MKWFYVFMWTLHSSIGGPYDSQESCVTHLQRHADSYVGSGYYEGEPIPSGVCFEGYGVSAKSKK